MRKSHRLLQRIALLTIIRLLLNQFVILTLIREHIRMSERLIDGVPIPGVGCSSPYQCFSERRCLDNAALVEALNRIRALEIETEPGKTLEPPTEDILEEIRILKDIIKNTLCQNTSNLRSEAEKVLYQSYE